MERTFDSPFCAVFDDVLPPDDLQRLFEYFRSIDFKFVHETRANMPKRLQSGYKRAWRLDEGGALTGSGFAAFALPDEQLPPEIRAIGRTWAEERDTKFYPSGTVMDLFLAPLKRLAAEELTPWVGRPGADWIAFTAAPYVHPAGVGMSWHADEVLYTGAFSFFVHPEWDAEFGGEFLIYDDAVKARVPDNWRNRRFDPLAVPAPVHPQADCTAGRFIAPIPNRLIVIKRGLMHKVNKVSPLAGSHVRASVTGFFLDTAVAGRVMG
ncbi:MAG TPA: hypothetical protein VNE16_14970 [Vicinamibacterales bacterium]|nr:hypothetical protein [Vicinamibacterales bacterium]